MEDDFINNFVNVFLEHSYNNHLFAFLALHLILGRCTWQVQIPKKRLWLDGRISFWYLAPPSSGKSTPYDFIKNVFEGIDENEKMHDVDDTSDVVLIGYTNDDDKKIQGTLDKGGIVHWDEAAMLLGTNQYAEKTKGFLQKALNPIGSETNRCTREFKNGIESITPTCSLYLTSYVPENIIEKVLTTGMLQRLLCLPKDITTEDRKKSAYTDIEYLGTVPSEKDISIEYFINVFRKIKEKYNHKDTIFDWSEIKPLFKSKSDNILRISSHSPHRVRKLMETFHPRYMDQMYKIAMHHCCIRDDNTINVDDIEYAYLIIANCFSALLAWLEEEPSFDSGKKLELKFFNEVQKLFKKEKEIGASVFFKKCCHLWGVSEPTARERIAPMVEAALKGEAGIEKKKKGRAVYYMLQKEQ